LGILIIITTEAIILDDSIRADNFLSNEVEEFISWLKKHIPPISYTFCLDISGSMNEEVSGNYTKIDFLKSIVKHVIHSAIPELFGITLITFNNNVSLEFKELIKDDYNKHLLIKKVENLSAFGTTALQDAIYIAFQENHSVN
jgi:Mg-chelatase subunit ChlD